MPRRFVDISAPLQAGIASDPPGFEPEIEYIDHKQTAPDVCRFFPGLTPEDLPGGEGWAIERLRIVTHNGTHLDAPYHFHSIMSRGERAISRLLPPRTAPRSAREERWLAIPLLSSTRIRLSSVGAPRGSSCSSA